MATAEINDEAPNSAPLGAMGSLLWRLDMLQCTHDGGSISELLDYIHNIIDKLKILSEVQDPPLTVHYWMKHARELSYDIEAYLDDLDAQTEDNLNDSNAMEEDSIDNSDDKTEYSVDDSHVDTEDNTDDSDANMEEDTIDDSDDQTEQTVENSDSSMQDSICSSDCKISGFRTRAKGMINRYEGFSLVDSIINCPTATTTIVSPRPFMDVLLVGMHNQVRKLISLLQPKDENDNQLKIVSILGDEGIGKSRLIQEIWRVSFIEKEIWHEMESEVNIKRAFIRMGKKPDVKMILRSLLSQVSLQEPAKDSGVASLIRDIRNHLEQKRYFIIIDDVWSLSVWDVVGRAFPHCSFGSRIITTTADKDVALACCSYLLEHNYIMEPLSVGDCKELFIRTVGLGPVNLQLSSQVLDDIRRKCSGLPLAIIWTASLVASRLETKQGLSGSEEQNQDSVLMKFLNENLRPGLTPVETMNHVFKLCYSSFPNCLKTCLLYLSVYPENYFFLKEDLVKLWIAEGFIITSEENKVEAAGRYFDVLVSLGLIQQMDINGNKQHHQGEVVLDEGEEYPLRLPYVMHPTVFDFVTQKSMEDNFITNIDYSQLKVAFKEKIRRLSLHFGSATYATTPESIGLFHVRTLSFMGLLSCMPSLVGFKLVRVLILHLSDDDGHKRFPLAEICKLYLLKYLQVSCNIAVELPGQIGCLKHLETLDIKSVLAAIPLDVFHLSRLLHLRLGLKQNRTLGPVTAVGICTDELLPLMDDSISTSTPSVSIFELLLPICIFSRFPKWMGQLQKLSILEIVVRELFTTDIDMLADLPELTVLSIYVRIPTTENIAFCRGMFPSLEYFRFMSGVLSLDFQEEAMPMLRQLMIGFNVHRMEKYDNILAGIQHLLNLHEVVASIGTTLGTEETERIAAESALKDAVYKHPYPTKFIVKRVHQVEEEYRPPRLDPLSINEQEEVPVIHGPKTEDPPNEQPINLDSRLPAKDTHGILQFSDIHEDDNSSTQQKSGTESVEAAPSATVKAVAGWQDRLVASEIHGFLNFSDLSFDKMMMEAGTRWFRPTEIYAVLANYAKFKVQTHPIDKPISGTVVLYDRKLVRNFRKDGHNWKKKKDGKTVQEDHVKIKIGNEEKVHVYYARGEDDPNFFRRCCWLLDKGLERIVLVHYRQTSEENALSPPRAEAEIGEVSPINMVHYTSPLATTDSASALTQLSSAAVAHCEPDDLGSRLESFWADLLESSVKSDAPVGASACGGSLVSNQQTDNGTRNSGITIFHANTSSNAIFSPTANVVSEAFANPGHIRTSEINFGSPKHQANNSPSLLTSDLHSQSMQLANSLMNPSVYGNMPIYVPARQNSLGLWKYMDDDTNLENNPSSGIRPTEQVTGEKPFHITEISSEWVYCTEDTKVLVVGYFNENYKHLSGTNLFCVIGDQCIVANIVQTGVYRLNVRPHVPGQFNLYFSLDGKTPISEILSFDYRMLPESQTLADEERKMSNLQMQRRLARLLFTTNKKMTPKLLVEGSKVSNLLSVSAEKEWMDLFKFCTDSEGTYISATEGLLELVFRNRLQEWLAEKVIEGQKPTDRDDLGQGPIHLCSFLGYTWAIRLFFLSGFSLDFRDSSGWTALHWAAYYGRQKMVAALLSAGANPSLVTDPTHDAPGGYTAADLAARQGYDGLAAYLAEKGLAAHFEAMSLAKDKRSTSRTQSLKQHTKEFENLSEQELCLRESLAAYRNAADAASNIQAALRERTLKLQTKAIQLANPETEAASIVAAMKIQHAFRNYNTKKIMRAAARIQSHFRTWQIRRNFMNMRREAIKIQAAYRGHQGRRQYRKVLWSVGVVEKAILRWRKKRKGLRGIATGMPVAIAADAEAASTAEEEYYRVGRQQAEDKFNRSVVHLRALFRSFPAQQEYRRMKTADDSDEEAKVDFSQK